MRRIFTVFFIFSLIILWTGCSYPVAESKKESTADGKSGLILHDNSLMPNEFIQEGIYKPLNYNVQHAMWFGYIDYEYILKGKTEEEFTKIITERFAKAKSIGINTLYVHVRAFCDAYYDSELFTKGEYSSDFDPLKVMVNCAHLLNLSIHAWVNPLRAQTDEQMRAMPDNYIIKQWYNDIVKKETYIVLVGERWYLNPAYSEARQLVIDGVKEIVSLYEVDGIHIDDYFYPTTEGSFDSASFAESNQSDLSQWRRENINCLVREMYSAIKTVNKNVQFGISPQGNIDKDYNVQYADVAKWGSECGYCDYMVPQLYYGFRNETCPFETTLSQWKNIVDPDCVKLVIGVCTYKIGKEDQWAGAGKDEWITDTGITSREIELIKADDKLNGAAIYSYTSTFEPQGEDTLITKVNNEREIIKNTLNN